MFDRILVPLDGSALAERAIPHAEQIGSIPLIDDKREHRVVVTMGMDYPI